MSIKLSFEKGFHRNFSLHKKRQEELKKVPEKPKEIKVLKTIDLKVKNV